MEMERGTTDPRPAPAPVLRIRNVDVGYGRKRILRDVSLDVREGVALGILGPNGSGKTTLLRAILGIIAPERGTIAWSGNGRRRARIGYVPQKERLDPSYPVTIAEVVRMGTYGDRPWSPWLRRAQLARVRAALERVRLADRASMLFAECSGGQRQRVLIARALASEPDVFILDEPTTGIDPASQREVVELLREIRRERTITMLIVTQHFGHLEALFEEVAWFQGGRVSVGPAKEFLTGEYISRAFGKV
ncbi:MAG: metal ABC transporter ATP-binding protein [Planctomycetes bacterium]|nr:metal ABC transporter ATP-binding protein [Planctomycetota bacterium]